jgi:hypothetical protein
MEAKMHIGGNLRLQEQIDTCEQRNVQRLQSMDETGDISVSVRVLCLNVSFLLLALRPCAQAQDTAGGTDEERRKSISFSFDQSGYSLFGRGLVNLMDICNVSGAYSISRRVTVRVAIGAGLIWNRELNLYNGTTYTLEGDWQYRIKDSSSSMLYVGISAIKPVTDVLYIQAPGHQDIFHYSSHLANILHLSLGMQFGLGSGCSLEVYTRIPLGANLQDGNGCCSANRRYLMIGVQFNFMVVEW